MQISMPVIGVESSTDEVGPFAIHSLSRGKHRNNHNLVNFKVNTVNRRKFKPNFIINQNSSHSIQNHFGTIFLVNYNRRTGPFSHSHSHIEVMKRLRPHLPQH